MRLLYLIPATEFGKGAYREYWRSGCRQKLFDLDGIVDRGVNGSAARACRKLEDIGSRMLENVIFRGLPTVQKRTVFQRTTCQHSASTLTIMSLQNCLELLPTGKGENYARKMREPNLFYSAGLSA
jgi:hypothetical protein